MSGDTGQTASRPDKRLADDRGGEGRGGTVGPPRPHHDGRQAQRAAVDKPLAAVIVDQELADRLLRPVGGLRRQRRVVADRRRQRAAIDRERAGENDARAGAERAAGIEHRARAVEVDAIAEIGVGLGFAADDGGEMEHRARAGGDHPAHRRAIGDVAGHQPQPPVLGQGQGRGCIVEQHELVDIAHARAGAAPPGGRESRNRR